MIENYYIFIGVGIILCLLGILMKIRKIDFLLSRYESFHKFLRKGVIGVDKDKLAKYYVFEFLLIGGLLLITGIIHLIVSINFEFNMSWIYIAIISIGIIGMLYLNFTNRFLEIK